jgi:hypothetical protein
MWEVGSMIRRIRLFDLRDYILQLPEYLHTENRKKKKKDGIDIYFHRLPSSPSPKHPIILLFVLTVGI